MAHAGRPVAVGSPALPRVRAGFAGRSSGRAAPYDVSRTWFRDEADYPGPTDDGVRGAAGCAQDARPERDAHERFLLVVDEFDPHEPFDTPSRGRAAYDADWDGPRIIWPPYARRRREGRAHRARGPARPRPVRRQAVDDRPLARSDPRRGRPRTMCGTTPRSSCAPTTGTTSRERGATLGQAAASPSIPRWATSRCSSRGRGTAAAAPTTRSPPPSTSTPRCATSFGVTPHRTHGASMVPLLDGSATSHPRAGRSCGVWGRGVHVADGHPHLRAWVPSRANRPAVDVVEPLVDHAHPDAFPDVRLPRPDRPRARTSTSCRAAPSR